MKLNTLTKLGIGIGLLWLLKKVAGKKLYAISTYTLQDYDSGGGNPENAKTYPTRTMYGPGEVVGRIISEQSPSGGIIGYWVQSSKNKNIYHSVPFFDDIFALKRPKIGGVKYKGLNYYDVVYRTKSGRLMVSTRMPAKTATEAKQKLKTEMRASSSFDKIIAAIKL